MIPDPAPRPRALIVLGMHRSGTSAVTRALNLLGAALPSNLMPAKEDDNSEGFWESQDLMEIHTEALASAGSFWFDHARFPPDWHHSDVARGFRERIVALLRQDFAATPLFVIKDPRICRFVPFWLDILAEFGAEPHFVIPVRHPLEVAASLDKRNQFQPAISLLLWLRHVLDAEADSRGYRRSILSYGTLLQDWRTTLDKVGRDLGVSWPCLSHKATNEINSFLSPRHRHAVFDRAVLEARPDIAVWVKRCFAAMEEASRAETPELRAALDVVRDELNRADLTYGPIVSKLNQQVSDHVYENNRLTRRIAARDSEITRLNELLSPAQRDVVLLGKRVAARDTEIIRLNTVLVAHKKDMVVQGREIAQLKRDKAAQAGVIVGRNNEIARLNKAITSLRTTIRQHENTIEELRQQIAALLNSTSWKVTRPLRAAKRLAQRLKALVCIKMRSLGYLVRCLRRHPPADSLKRFRSLVVLRLFGTFDVASYCLANPDVVKADIHPLIHYVFYGQDEKRPLVPSPSAGSPPPAAARSGNSGAAGTGPETAAELLTPPARSTILWEMLGRDEPAARPRLSIITLNRNGAPLLEALFRTLSQFNSYPIVEYILVDHGSTDASLAIAAAWQDRLPLRIVPCRENFSFSYSNNRAAEMASGEVLLFLNNDIVLDQDVLAHLIACLARPEVGIVGVKQFELDAVQGSEPPGVAAYHHIGIRFRPDPATAIYRPSNIKPVAVDTLLAKLPAAFPAVTASFMLVRKDEFLAVGGFNEGYDYGFEDVDFCLKMRDRLGKQVVSVNDTYVLHGDGRTRKEATREEKLFRRHNNDTLLQRRYGYFLRRETHDRHLTDDGAWTWNPLTVAFAVTEAHPGTRAGDYFTALEFGTSLARRFGWQIRYIPLTRWYLAEEMRDVDVLIAMRDDYNPHKLAGIATPGLITVAWLRNWFEQWPARIGFNGFDLVLCSSQRAADYIRRETGLPAEVLRIATNARRFQSQPVDESLRSDYVFTGSYWGVDRDIGSFLNPDALPYQGAIYGAGWEQNERLAGIHRGFLEYEQLPRVYHATRIVIDDANHVTKPFGSVNSRVFDALAAGALVVSNGTLGAQETFGDLLPTFETAEELDAVLRRYLGDEALRTDLVVRLQAEVLARHTYDHRAEEFFAILARVVRQSYRIAIKIPVPRHEEIEEWGDYHFAEALGRALRGAGHRVRIDILPEWERPEAVDDDVVLVLRGLSAYTPRPGQINLMWNISHPDKVPDEEYERYDQIFVASTLHAQTLVERLQVPVAPLLQCTDPRRFQPADPPLADADPLLFVGNSRNVYRRIVRDAIAAGLTPAVYGTRWEPFFGAPYLKGDHIPNDMLPRHYSSAAIVLNDHWESMAAQGFLSNRLFDAGAAGAFIISDPAAGLGEVFGDSIVTYDTAEDLKAKVAHYLADPAARVEKAARLRELVINHHSFHHRATEILAVIDRLHATYVRGPVDAPLVAGQGGFPASALLEHADPGGHK